MSIVWNMRRMTSAGRGTVMRVVSVAGKNVKRLPEDRAAMARVLGTDVGIEE